MEEKVENATSEILEGRVDWGMNLEICDEVSSGGNAEEMVKAVEKRLSHQDGRVQFLALTLIETCVKNCGSEMHQAVSRIVGSVAKVGEVSSRDETRNTALGLVQAWAGTFKGRYEGAYEDAYTGLKVKGVEFPEPVEDVPVFTPESSLDAKIKNDLEALSDKIQLCNDMVPLSEGIENDEALAEVVGFLEACKPRMVNLIEAARSTVLSDAILDLALRVNDDLDKALQFEIDTANARNGTPPPQPSPPVDNLLLDPQDDEEEEENLSRGGASSTSGGGGEELLIDFSQDEQETTSNNNTFI